MRFLNTKYVLISGLIIFAVLGTAYFYSHAEWFASMSDTITDSKPGAGSDHHLEFAPRTAVPAGGKVIITPQDSAFNIPSAFDHEDMDFIVGGIQHSLAASADSTTDGVSVTSGNSGFIEITLNSTTGISAGTDVEVLMGTNASFEASGDTSITNPSVAGSYEVWVETQDGAGNILDKSNTLVAIINPINMTADATDPTPPVRSNGLPSGELPHGTTSVEISLETDEVATCRYDTVAGTDYSAMTNIITDTAEQTLHSTEVTTEDGETYEFYVRCANAQGLANEDDFLITFSVEETPEPGSEPGDEGGEDEPATGGTGSGSGERYPPETASFNFVGRAFPGANVLVLIDGEVEAEASASANGGFDISVSDITKGVYTFTVYAENDNEEKTGDVSTTLTVRPDTHTTVGGIFLSPTITATPNPAEPGDEIVLSGDAYPNSDISIRFNRKGASGAGSIQNFSTTTDGSGSWSYALDTTGMQADTYQAQARARLGGEESDLSPRLEIGLGVELEEGECGTADLNCDGSVNLTDFSILLFWWNSDGGTSDPSADINSNGTVDLPDFSIMLFNWTG